MGFYLGLILFIAGVYFLLVNLNIINKKKSEVTDKPIEARKVDNILIRTASVIMCIIGIYLIWPDENKQQSKVTTGATTPVNQNTLSSNTWTEELKSIINKQCLENGKKTSEEYPELVNDYCKCATDKISEAMTPNEYTQWMEKPMEEQAQYIRPIVQTCADIMNKLIELTQQTKPQREELKEKIKK
jgi:hypothetical protein